jgi:hypothetical protein
MCGFGTSSNAQSLAMRKYFHGDADAIVFRTVMPAT